MVIRDGAWTLHDHDMASGRCVWHQFDGEKDVFRVDYPVDNLISENQGVRNNAEKAWRGDWHRVASIPLNVAHSSGLDLLLLSPASAGPGTIIDYVSKNWVLGDPFEQRDTLKADDDRPLFAERLLAKGILWRWKRQKGLAYDDSLAEFEADLIQEINADRGAS